jgi:hypothetical protein
MCPARRIDTSFAEVSPEHFSLNQLKKLTCVDCGSSLFSRPEVLEGITLIKSGCLDETNIPIALEMFATRRCDYVAPVANAPQVPEMP